MPGSSSNNSFIPKRGSAIGAKRKSVSRQVYVFTIVSYVVLFATLLATGGVFLYENYLKSERDAVISQLHSDITSFSRADMEELQQFDRYLAQAYGRLDMSVSVSSIFSAIEAATIDTVRLDTLGFDREGDAAYVLAATIKTDSFDSTIFQRKVFENNAIVSSVTVSDVKAASSKSGVLDDFTEGGGNARRSERLSFTAELGVPLSAVPYVPGAVPQSVMTPPQEPAIEQVKVESQPAGVNVSDVLSEEVANEVAI